VNLFLGYSLPNQRLEIGDPLRASRLKVGRYE